VDPPKVHKDEVRPLTSEQACRLLRTARGDRLEALYVMAIQSGLRQGELLAMRWEDVDLETRTVQVRRTLTRNGGKLAVGSTKTAKGRRTVTLTQDATQALRRHLERQLVEIDMAGEKCQENGLVFCTGRGTLINPTNLRRRSLTPPPTACQPCPDNVSSTPAYRRHHTAAAKERQPQGGLRDAGARNHCHHLDTYSHVLPDMQHSAVAAMEEVFS
jgi:integrase